MCSVTTMNSTSTVGRERKRSLTVVSAVSDASLVKGNVCFAVSLPKQKKLRRRKQDITSVLLSITPTSYARAAFKANGYGNVSDIEELAESLFEDPSKEMINAHRIEVVVAVRRNDLATIRHMHRSGALTLNACNKFGESILHIACHRGHVEMVRYMLCEMKMNVQTLRDDYRRTALHDACWTTEPAFEVVDMLLEHAPQHVLMKDVRGFTPFDYARKEDHGKWLRFLWERKHKLQPSY